VEELNRHFYRWFLLAPCLSILAAWDQFIVPAGTNTSDILISHFPNLLFIQRSLSTGAGIPLWSSSILSGYPFAADPLSSLWYPPAWLCLLFPLPLGINLVLALHVLLGGIGFYYLLRQMNISEGVAILGGILFSFLPAEYSHIIAGHFTWVCAFAWLPWLLCTAYLAGTETWKVIAYRAFCLGMMMLADLRFAAFAAILWLAYVGFRDLIEWNKKSIKERGSTIASLAGSLLAAAGISAITWIPLLDYTRLSTRVLMTAADSLYLSLPPVQLTGLFVPGHPSSMEWILYTGSAILLLVFISLAFLRSHKELWFWLTVGSISLIWALGEIIPLNTVLVSLPVFNLLRVPSRGVLFLSIALLVIAMIVLNRLIRSNPEKAVYLRLVTIGVTTLVAIIQGFIIASNPEKNQILIWNLIFWVFTAAIILLYSYRKVSAKIFLLAVGIVGILDLVSADQRLTQWRTFDDALSDGKTITSMLADKGRDFRTFSSSYSIPQHIAAVNGIEMADGIDPMQIKTYSDFIRQAIQKPVEGYSVTLPAFGSGNPEIDNLGLKPDAKMLGLLNIRYMASAFPIDSDSWVLLQTTKDEYLYQNNEARGWAWVEPGNSSSGSSFRPVEKIVRTNNQIQVEASGPGTLVLSEIYYPGWQARMDGIPVIIEPAHQILRSIKIPVGQHKIEFDFIPTNVYMGGGISLTSLLICFLLSRLKRNNA
jgi:hypothetical protein